MQDQETVRSRLTNLPFSIGRHHWGVEDFLFAMRVAARTPEKIVSSWFLSRMIGYTWTFMWDGFPISLRQLLVEVRLCKSLSEADRQIKQGAVTVNEGKIKDPAVTIDEKSFVFEGFLWLGVGKATRVLLVKSEDVLSEVLPPRRYSIGRYSAGSSKPDGDDSSIGKTHQSNSSGDKIGSLGPAGMVV